ncbi:acyltransferase [Pseudomonas sp. LABIM340]|uniref:acyltransferase family protein n=1 Tax=Pseudomonas sp. LABIM340 TaxID=3156585 RepID=UPI0032AFE696
MSALPHSQIRLHGPDVLRGFAALGVVFFHVLYLSGLPQTAITNFLFGRLDFLVRLFFSISAFSICYAYYNRIDSKVQLRSFYINRFFRIAPLFYFALALSIAISYILGRGLPSLYDFVLSLSFLFPFVPGKHGSLVGGGWSLGLEWLFYVFFPILICFCRGILTSLSVWVGLLFIALCRYTYFTQGGTPAPLYEYGILFFLSHAPFFLVGVLLYFLFERFSGRQYNIPAISGISIIGITLITMSYFYFKLDEKIPEEIFLSLASFSLIALSILGMPRVLDNALTRHLGSISYSVYLMQFPVIAIVGHFGFYGYILDLSKHHTVNFLLAAVFTATVVIFVSHFTHKLIELPLIKVGRSFAKRQQPLND